MPLLPLLIAALVITGMLALVTWQLATGRALGRNWKTLYRRHDEPFAYWLLLAWQLAMTAVIIAAVSWWGLLFWRNTHHH